MLHGASSDEALSVRDPIAIRYRPPLRFSKEHDFYSSKISKLYRFDWFFLILW
jgi:hypothetical protein